MEFVNWLYNLMEKGLSVAIHRYYSIYRAQVTDNKDPEGRGRIKALCHQVGQTKAPEKWILPAMQGAGNGRGLFFTPDEGDTVWLSFYEGDPALPEVYWGGWFGQTDEAKTDSPPAGAEKSEVPTLLSFDTSKPPEKKGLITRSGSGLIFNDEDGKESWTLLWNRPADDDPAKSDRTKTGKLNTAKSTITTVDKNGSFLVKTVSSYIFQIDEDKKNVTIMAPNGSMININEKDDINLVHKNGSSISMNSSSIDISGNTTKAVTVNISGQNVILNGGGVLLGGKAIDFAVLGIKLIAWLAKHIHGTALGPSTQPIIPPTPADFLSKTVKVQE